MKIYYLALLPLPLIALPLLAAKGAKMKNSTPAPTALPLVTGHRGGRALGPENTLAAARAGHAAGADMWELDTQLTKDLMPMVLHDATLKRTTNVAKVFPKRANAPLSAFTVAEVKKLDAGSWWARRYGKKALADGRITKEQLDYYASGKVRIPTLEEALRLTKDLDWRVNVEIKVFHPGHLGPLVPKVLETIRKTGTVDRVVISSFDHAVCYAIAHAKEPHPPVQLLTSMRLARPDLYVRDVAGAQALNPSIACLGIGGTDEAAGDPPAELTVKRLRDAGLGINVWTVNDPKIWAWCVKVGVTSIITDSPDLLRAWLKKQR